MKIADAPSGLTGPLRAAGFRLRLRHAAMALRAAIPAATLVVAVAVLLSAFTSADPNSLGRTVIVAVAALVVLRALLAALRCPPLADCARLLDRESGLPDSTLSAFQLHQRGGAWPDAVAVQARERLRPLPEVSRELRKLGPGMGVVALFVVVAALWFPVPTRPTSAGTSLPESVSLDSLQVVVSDWERFVADAPDPTNGALKEAAARLKALTETPTSKEAALVEIGRVEDRLNAAGIPDSSTLAAALAATAPSVSDALKAGDFKAAAAQAGELATEGVPSLPAASDAAEMAALAERMQAAGQQALADALRAMSRAANAADAAKALQQLSLALSQAADAAKILEMARMQLAAAREAMGNTAVSAGLDDIPKLPGAEEQPPGLGAGADTGQGQEGQGGLEDLKVLMPLTGVRTDAGETAAEILPSDTPANETPRTPASGATARVGEISRTAVEEENLPLAHRATIRRYFDAIRPTPTNQ